MIKIWIHIENYGEILILKYDFIMIFFYFHHYNIFVLIIMTGKEDLCGFNIQLYNMAMSISQIDSSLKETLWLLIDQ